MHAAGFHDSSLVPFCHLFYTIFQNPGAIVQEMCIVQWKKQEYFAHNECNRGPTANPTNGLWQWSSLWQHYKCHATVISIRATGANSWSIYMPPTTWPCTSEGTPVMGGSREDWGGETGGQVVVWEGSGGSCSALWILFLFSQPDMPPASPWTYATKISGLSRDLSSPITVAGASPEEAAMAAAAPTECSSSHFGTTALLGSRQFRIGLWKT